MDDNLINWNRVTLFVLSAVFCAFIIGTIWVFVDIWLPYQTSRQNTQRIKEYIEKNKIRERYPAFPQENGN